MFRFQASGMRESVFKVLTVPLPIDIIKLKCIVVHLNLHLEKLKIIKILQLRPNINILIYDSSNYSTSEYTLLDVM